MTTGPGRPTISLKREAIDSVLRVGGASLLRRLIDVAEANVRRRMEEWAAALGASPPDLAGAERAAHSIKSSAAYLGVEELRHLAAELEAAVRDGHLVDLEPKSRQVEILLDAALPVLEAELLRHGG